MQNTLNQQITPPPHIELDHIYNMDCLEGMRAIPDGSVDCIICDPPYGTTINEWDVVIPWNELWKEYKRVCKTTAAVLLFGAEPFSTAVRISNIKEYRYDWIWQKDNSVGFLSANKRPLRIHENISVFYREQPPYNPQGLRYNPKKQRRGNVGKNYHNASSNEYTTEYENYPTDVLFFAKDTDTFHPTQKPVNLIRYLIATYSNPGDTILDNCIGSGTTAVAAIREKRHFIGFELDKTYFEKATRRIKAEQAQLTLF